MEETGAETEAKTEKTGRQEQWRPRRGGVDYPEQQNKRVWELGPVAPMAPMPGGISCRLQVRRSSLVHIIECDVRIWIPQ